MNIGTRVGSDRSIADCIFSCGKAINIGQKFIAEKEPLGLKYITANLFHKITNTK